MLKYYREYKEYRRDDKDFNSNALAEFGINRDAVNRDAEVDITELSAEDIGNLLSGYAYYHILRIRQGLIEYSNWLETKKGVDVSGFIINLKDVFLYKEKYIDFSKTYFESMEQMFDVFNDTVKKNHEQRVENMNRSKRADTAFQRNVPRLRICLYLIWKGFTTDEIMQITPHDVTLGNNTVCVGGCDFTYDDIMKDDFALAVESAEEQRDKAVRLGHNVLYNLMQTSNQQYFLNWKLVYIYNRDPKTRICTSYDNRFTVRHIQKAAIFFAMREYEMQNGKILISKDIPKGVSDIIERYRDIEDATAMQIISEYNIINR